MNRIFGKRGNKMYALTVNNLKQLFKKNSIKQFQSMIEN